MRGTLRVQLKGSEVTEARTLLPAPEWNFVSPGIIDRIVATPIRKIERVDGFRGGRPGRWWLDRKVEFCCGDSSLVTLNVVGQKFDGDEEGRKEGTNWAISSIGYFITTSEHIDGYGPTLDGWKEYDLEVPVAFGHICA